MAETVYPENGYECQLCGATLYSLADRLKRCDYCWANVQHLTNPHKPTVALPFPNPDHPSIADRLRRGP